MPFFYGEASQKHRPFFTMLVVNRSSHLPVYSGDLALALQLSHRLVKDQIERFYPALHQTFGEKIWTTRHKRGKIGRQMRGYILPLCAALPTTCAMS